MSVFGYPGTKKFSVTVYDHGAVGCPFEEISGQTEIQRFKKTQKTISRYIFTSLRILIGLRIFTGLRILGHYPCWIYNQHYTYPHIRFPADRNFLDMRPADSPTPDGKSLAFQISHPEGAVKERAIDSLEVIPVSSFTVMTARNSVPCFRFST